MPRGGTTDGWLERRGTVCGVQLADYAPFHERMNSPFVDPTVAGWHLFDLDPDYDVDLRDFAELQNAFGVSVP